MSATMNSSSAQQQMIAQQVRTWSVLDARTLEVMQQVPRERFVPASWASLALSLIHISEPTRPY